MHTDGHAGRRYIVETVTSGIATFDYDGDGWIDLFLGNGADLPGAESAESPRDVLARNLGGFRFEHVAAAAGVDDDGFTVGMTAADYDNDGFQDLYLSRFGTNRLFRNLGDGTFADVTDEAGVGRGHKLGAGVTFLDVDADGDLDLFVANYVRFQFADHVVIREDGIDRYAGPRSYPLDTHALFSNAGDGTFRDVSEASGIAAHPGSGMGVVAADFDGDGDADLFVLNDVHRNFLFENDGGGRFTEVGMEAGCAFNGTGDELGSMGIDAGDYDGDGQSDCVVTTYEGESPVLFRNDGGFFEDVTAATGAGNGLVPHVTWGVGMVDFDNDGWRDLYYACGHLQDSIDSPGRPTAYRVRDHLLRNVAGRFREVPPEPAGLDAVASSRGAAFDDLDDDGRMDVVVLNARDRPTVLRNVSTPAGRWLGVNLVGTRGSRDAIGAKVWVEAAGRRWFAEVLNGRGYQGHFGRRLHFGLGDAPPEVRLEVKWLGGETTVVETVSCDRVVTVVEPLPGVSMATGVLQ
ncbi:MAG: CRTAC1 family protein [Planctomycetaceae bacterium]